MKCVNCEGAGQFVAQVGSNDYEQIMCETCQGSGEVPYDCGGCGSCPRRGDCVTHPDADPPDSRNPYSRPYDDALAGHLRNWETKL